MKKFVLFLSMGLLGVSQLQAQRISVGPEIGINFTNLRTDWDDYDVDNEMIPGLKVGGIVDIGVTRMFSIQPGLFFSMKGAQNDFTRTFSAPGGVYRERIERRTRINYMEIPLNFQFRFGHFRRGGFFLGAGPYLAIATGGKVDYERTTRLQNGGGTIRDREEDTYDLEIGNDPDDDDIKGADAGINMNLGYMGPHGFFVRGNMGIGLANIIPDGDDDYSAKNFGVSATVGFLFGR